MRVHISKETLEASVSSEVRPRGTWVTMTSGTCCSYFGPLSHPSAGDGAQGARGGRRWRRGDLPGVGGDLAEVAQAAVGGVAGGDAGRVAVDRVHLGLLVVGPRDVRVSPLVRLPVDQGPAARQVHGAEDRGGHARGRVDAAVRGGALDVRQPRQLGVHQVPGPKVLVVAVARGVAGERVAAGMAGAAFFSDLEKKERNGKASNKSRTLLLHEKVIPPPRTQEATNQMISPEPFLLTCQCEARKELPFKKYPGFMQKSP